MEVANVAGSSRRFFLCQVPCHGWQPIILPVFAPLPPVATDHSSCVGPVATGGNRRFFLCQVCCHPWRRASRIRRRPSSLAGKRAGRRSKTTAASPEGGRRLFRPLNRRDRCLISPALSRPRRALGSRQARVPAGGRSDRRSAPGLRTPAAVARPNSLVKSWAPTSRAACRRSALIRGWKRLARISLSVGLSRSGIRARSTSMRRRLPAAARSRSSRRVGAAGAGTAGGAGAPAASPSAAASAGASSSRSSRSSRSPPTRAATGLR